MYYTVGSINQLFYWYIDENNPTRFWSYYHFIKSPNIVFTCDYLLGKLRFDLQFEWLARFAFYYFIVIAFNNLNDRLIAGPPMGLRSTRSKTYLLIRISSFRKGILVLSLSLFQICFDPNLLSNIDMFLLLCLESIVV